jgi:hypothetical protein
MKYVPDTIVAIAHHAGVAPHIPGRFVSQDSNESPTNLVPKSPTCYLLLAQAIIENPNKLQLFAHAD